LNEANEANQAFVANAPGAAEDEAWFGTVWDAFFKGLTGE
jgi:hypothetical protein